MIGTDAGGLTAIGNKHGVLIESAGNTVGGATTDDGNVISGNTQSGVYILGAAATGNMIQSNRIGIDGDGAVANARSGVLIENAPGNTIGGADSSNAIGGNTQQGIRIAGAGSTGNLVQDNSIGFEGLTMTVIPNRDGVRIADDASDNTIGGAGSLGNAIANNTRIGVWVSKGTGNKLTQNSIHDNGALGISIGVQGTTPNDPDTGSGADADAGANNWQNVPVFPLANSVVVNDVNLDVTFRVDSAVDNSQYDLTVEFFLADSGNQEGETFLGAASYPAAQAGNPIAVSIPKGAAVSGNLIVATAIDTSGNTSEFSATATVAESLLASVGELNGGSARSLTHPTLARIVDAAVARFVAGGFASQLFDHVEVAIADLPGATLGRATGNTVTIDINAAGYDWFIDVTPLDDAEFDSGSRLSTLNSRLRIDLLTAVMHELGHVVGLPDLYDSAAEDALMFGWLEPGVRWTSLAASLADNTFAEF